VDNDVIEEMFAGLGPVAIRSMFGGKGIYFEGRIIAIELADEILLKADPVSGPDFAAAGARQWRYEGKKGQAVAMPYWTIPDAAIDDPDMLNEWVTRANEAAIRAGARKGGRPRAAGHRVRRGRRSS
jgi:DNA transformation protein and related proteins